MAPMKRRTRATAAILAIVAMLLAPLAMALHACPTVVDMTVAAQPLVASATPPADEVAPMDMAQCERHCNLEAKTSYDLAKPPAALVAAVVPALRVPPLQCLSARKPAASFGFATQTGPAPPFLRSAVLRV
jgi:hypothetical protein